MLRQAAHLFEHGGASSHDFLHVGAGFPPDEVARGRWRRLGCAWLELHYALAKQARRQNLGAGVLSYEFERALIDLHGDPGGAQRLHPDAGHRSDRYP